MHINPDNEHTATCIHPLTAYPRRDCLKSLVGIGLSVLPLFFSCNTQAALDNKLSQFMAVSQALTARPQLSVEIGQRLLTAFEQVQPNFATGLPALQQALANKVKLTPEQLALRKQLLQAWYTGIVNDAVVMYERALMFESVKTVLPIRSYCVAKPGFWASKPEVKSN